MIRRILSRRSRSRREDFLDDLSSYYLGFGYVFWPLCLRISHLRIICLPLASQYSCFQTSRAGRPAILHVLRRCVRCLMMTGLFSIFSTFGRFVSLCTTNARLESYSFLLVAFLFVQNNYLLENIAFPDDLSSILSYLSYFLNLFSSK